MKIKQRVIGEPKAITTPGDGKFPAIEAKPKEPLPPTSAVLRYGDCPTAAQLRSLGPLALSEGAAAPDENMTVADRLTLLRTPYDPTNAQEARYRNRVRNRATAITAMCVVCMGGRKLVTECADVTCPLWAFRLGSNPFRRKT